MRRLEQFALSFLLAAVALPARAEVGVLPPVVEVLGSVTTAARPVANALVIALNLKDLAAVQTYSSADGSFSLSNLPSGIYKIIAVKQGFAPAVATLVPKHATHRVALALEDEKHASRRTADEMWQIRASLPPDILHQVDMAIASPVPAAAQEAYSLPRVRGEMVSMTAVSDQTATAATAQTSVGVEGRLSDAWQLGIKGNLRRVDSPVDLDGSNSPAAQSSVMSMELRSSPTDSYRVATTKSSWRYRPDTAEGAADFRSHDFEWEHGTARVGVRYLAQENLFASNPFGSDVIEVTGGTTVLQTRRNDVGVALRMTQENIHSGPSTASFHPADSTLRTADVTAIGSFAFIPAFIVRYGVSSRMSLDRTELAPRAGMQWKFAKDASIVADGMVKTIDPFRTGAILPTVGGAFDDGRLLPRYAASLGIVAGDENASHISAIASVTAIEAPVRVVFNDGYEQFWDGLYVDSGDVRRDVRISGRRDFGGRIAVDLSTSAGTATPARALAATKSYVTGDIQTIYFPTGTSLLVSYRELRQPQNAGEYRSAHVNVRMAQSLHLPLDLKVLLGLEIAHAENSPFLLDVVDDTANGVTRRYVGGLAVNF